MNEILSDDDMELFIKIFVLLYADDTVVLAESPSRLQTLNSVYEYCKFCKLQVNTSKTKIVIFFWLGITFFTLIAFRVGVLNQFSKMICF